MNRYLRLISFCIKFKLLIVHSSGLEWAGSSTVRVNYKNKKAYTHMQKAQEKYISEKFLRDLRHFKIASFLPIGDGGMGKQEKAKCIIHYDKCTCFTVDL